MAWVVSEAGDDSFNGTYEVAGQIGGVDYYSNGTRYLVFVAGNWFLAATIDPTPFTAEYWSSGETPATSDGAWSLAPGGDGPPAPTVVSGDAPPEVITGPFPTHFRPQQN